MAMQELREDVYGGGHGGGRLGGGASRREARPGGVVAGRGRPDFGEVEDDEGSGTASGRRTGRTGRGGLGPGLRLTFRMGLVPASARGRVLAGVMLLAGVGMLAGAGYEGRRYLLHDERFVIPSSSAIEIEGNRHVTRAQVLSVFGEDVERNIFRTSLEERRVELEAMPWVAHATVMRLLPNRLRVAVVERTPVAFVREGKRIALVDGGGVLLDMAPDGEESGQYSFPVVTGVTQDLPLSVRAARMRLYARFREEMDRSPEGISSKVSEVDLSNPEDVKALLPDQATEILVHFGDRDFLERYEKFRDEMPGWRTQYPKLASADMRYDRQVVLEMQPGAAVPVGRGASVSAPVQKKDVKAKVVGKVAPKVAGAAPVHPAKAVAGRGTRDLAAFGQPHFPGDVTAPPAGKRPAKQ